MFLPNAEIKDAFLKFDPKKAITTDSPYYVNCDDVRGEAGKNIASKIAAWIDIGNDEGKNYAHCLFTGHVGSGKSSELRNAQKTLQEKPAYQYHVIYLNALETLDINDIYPTDILLAIAQKVYEEFNLPKTLLQNVERWFAEVVYETTQEKEYKGLVEAGLDMGANIPFLAKLFAKFSGQISKGGTQRESIRRQLQKNMSELLRKVNDMLQAAAAQCLAEKKKGVVLLIDELEKMVGATGKQDDARLDVALYVTHGHLLTGLQCHLICTVPIFLLNSTSRTFLEKNFDKIFELPVIKIKDKAGNEWSAGMQKLIEIARKRLEEFPQLGNLQLFGGDENLLRQIAERSGGQVRSFIQLMRNVLSACRIEQQFPVDQALLDQVLREEVRAYDMAIFDDRFTRLVEVANTKQIRREENNSIDFEMLQQGWVLAYTNQEWWYDIMPAIRFLERYQRAEVQWKAQAQAVQALSVSP